MKKIFWVTADYFIDCDISIVDSLSKQFEIEWHIVLPSKKSRYSKEFLDKSNFAKLIPKVYHYTKYRFRDFKYIIFYWKLISASKRTSPDILYINLQGFPYLAFIVAMRIKKQKVIFAVHQAEVHEGMQHQFITKLYFRFLYSWFTNFNLFSDSQTAIFRKNHPGKNLFLIPLGLKYFGESTQVPPKDKVVFFNFGTMIKNKNIGLLIQAACNIYEKGFKEISIKLVGSCSDWNQYARLIRYPELFELRIESIENKEIPDLFCSSHYLILPYSAVSQSGPLKIAFNYNIPVIASDLDEFKSEISDNVTGYLFESENVLDLEKVLIKAITNHSDNYELLKTNQLKDIEKRYSLKFKQKEYSNMFNTLEKIS